MYRYRFRLDGRSVYSILMQMKLYLRGNLLCVEWREQISRQQFMPHLCKNRAPINAKKGDIEISAKNKKDTWVYLRLLFDYRKLHMKFAIKILWILGLTFWIGAINAYDIIKTFKGRMMLGIQLKANFVSTNSWFTIIIHSAV